MWFKVAKELLYISVIFNNAIFTPNTRNLTNSLVTEEDDEECYEPRPQWAKVMGQDAASKKRQQLSSDCEALKDLDMEALYIAHSSISDLHKIGEGMQLCMLVFC